MDFQSSLINQSIPIAIDFDPKRNVLLITFSGLAQRIGMPFFEFNNITSRLRDINKIFLRDTHKLWFHQGLPEIGNNIDDIATTLRKYTKHPSIRKTVVFGSSGGGYAALLLGYLLQVDEIHAFSPKTFIDPIQRILNYDIPWAISIKAYIRLYLHGQSKYFDLRPVFQAPSPRQGIYHVYYAQNHRIDNIHATRMKSLSGVHLHPFHYNNHNLVHFLKKTGELGNIIEQSISL